MEDLNAFSNAYRLIVLMNACKLVKFYQNVFCFFKILFIIGQYDPFHTTIDKEFTASIKKMER